MARPLRVDVGDLVYHVINRANGRLQIFETENQYKDFEYLLNEMREEYDMRILGYVIMPNHWHLLLQPKKDGDLSKAIGWLSTSHTRRYHAQTRTIGGGHLYQGRYKSFLVKDDKHLLTVLKYIERNPARAHLVHNPVDWQWGSAYRRLKGSLSEKTLLAELPLDMPFNYRQWLNEPELSEELDALRKSVGKGVPFGCLSWRKSMIEAYNLGQTVREPGRPRGNN